MIEHEIHRLAEERQYHWRVMGSEAPAQHRERAERVLQITRLLNGHSEDIRHYGPRGEGLYGEKRARFARGAKTEHGQKRTMS